jgi:hypothetical protein
VFAGGGVRATHVAPTGQNLFEDQLMEVATLGRAMPAPAVALLARLLAERTAQLRALLDAARQGGRAALPADAGAVLSARPSPAMVIRIDR